MAKSKDQVLYFGKTRSGLSAYRCRLINGEYAVCWGEPDFDLDQRHFTCPNDIEGHPVSGVFITSDDSISAARFKVLFIDCNLRVFQTSKRAFDCIKTIIFGEHFTATDGMIKTMIKDLQEMNPSLRKKFPKVKYWDGREVDVSNYINTQTEFAVTVQFDKKGNQKANYRTSDKNIKVGTIVMVEGNNFYARAGAHYEDIEAVVCEINTKFSGFIENLKPIKKVVSYGSNFVPNDLSEYFDVKELPNGVIEIKRKGRGNKFKELVFPDFGGRKVAIAENGFEKCNIGTITFECNVVSVGKDAFIGSTIKKIKNYKKVDYLNVEDDVLRLNLLKHALKDHKPGDKKNYLTEDILTKDLVVLFERAKDKSIFNSEDEIRYAVDRLHNKNLTNYIDFDRSNKKMDILNTICTYNAMDMKQIENKAILSYIKNNYESLLSKECEIVSVLLVRKDIYQSWAGFPKSDLAICELISKIATSYSSSIMNAFSDGYYYHVDYSDYGDSSFINDCVTVIERCKKNNVKIDLGFNYNTGKNTTFDDVIIGLKTLIKK